MQRNKQIMWLYKEIPELVRKGIFSNETAEKIREYLMERLLKSNIFWSVSWAARFWVSRWYSMWSQRTKKLK